MDAITIKRTVYNAEGTPISGYVHPDMFDFRPSPSDIGPQFPSYESSQDSDLGNGNGRLITIQESGLRGGPYNQSKQVYLPEGDLNGLPELAEVFSR